MKTVKQIRMNTFQDSDYARDLLACFMVHEFGDRITNLHKWQNDHFNTPEKGIEFQLSTGLNAKMLHDKLRRILGWIPVGILIDGQGHWNN